MKKWCIFLLLLLVSCTEQVTITQTVTDNTTTYNESIYEQALKNRETNSINLDKRYNILKQQIAKLTAEELKMTTFTRIKIELDYLETMEYNQNKINQLTKQFLLIFSNTSSKDEFKGYNLNDRLHALTRKIEQISKKEQELTVADYLQIEKELSKLGGEDFLTVRVDELRNQLLTAVIAELETAAFSFEPPIIEETVEKGILKEELIVESQPIVRLIDGGFDKDVIKINVNDTIIWQNVRQGRYKVALIIGNRECRFINSGFFQSGESFNATFTEPMTCWISDGIFTTQAMRVIVS